ncbi:Flp pilus assembly protein CpaB [Comamonas sp. Y6]|uniref:Flp pilus assembly protein CpaB n=1 Tax=Comamonas resistens TaxID=3046670 RepID=A0ABY8SQG9_9BURK|nr:Flp pilus assembly protein CpaB [Comamonas resistens]MDL5035898.1 Flp pilus assembly protein CpaB [Comamonas resistens]WHS65302.1 Flp pilus assembly protein CpaB [Comamonas resistens]
MNLTKILAGILVVLAIGLAIMAWFMGRQPQRNVAAVPAAQTASAAEASSPKPAPMHDVVVAARQVAAGQKLAAEDLKVVQQPAAVADGVKTADAAVGHTTLIALAADAPLLEQNLVNGLSLQLEPGQRALSIAVKEPMAAGNHVRPGDFVDVFFTLDGKNDSGNDKLNVDTQTRLLLARSRVLAYGATSVENPPPTAAQRRKTQEEEEAANKGQRRSGGDQGRAQVPANTALLAVPLEDVERLTLAEKYGQLTLALRHPDDMSVPDASLFAALPTALQPVAGRLPKGETLQGADRSFAGLRFNDLATGADARNARRPAPASSAPRAPQAPRQQTVQVHQGAAVQTVSY